MPRDMVCDAPIYGPMEHHQVGDVHECRCTYCLDCWKAREKMRLLTEQIAETPCKCKRCQIFEPGGISAHSRSCKCKLCVPLEKALVAFLAAQNRRDVLSELSYHAVHDEDLDGPSLMSWLEQEMSLPRPSWTANAHQWHRKRSTQATWWGSSIAMRYTIDDWISQFIFSTWRAVAAVSGHTLTVFEEARL